MKNDRNIVLVAGASSGLGLAVAGYLFKRGYTVYAGARSFKTDSTEQNPEGRKGILNKVYLDVTDQASIDRVIQQIIDREGRLDVLVNCAAIIVLGPVEEISMEEYRGVIETNLFGTLRMCKGAIPIMRKQGNGLIVNFSSALGILAIPYQSAYIASKFAVEGLTEALSMEVKKFGIDVVIIEPGDHRYSSEVYRPHAVKADLPDSPYSGSFKKVTANIEKDEANGSYPIGVAKLVYKIINNEKPRLRYTVGQFVEKLAFVVKKLLPGRLFEKAIFAYYHR